MIYEDYNLDDIEPHDTHSVTFTLKIEEYRIGEPPIYQARPLRTEINGTIATGSDVGEALEFTWPSLKWELKQAIKEKMEE